MTDVKAFGQNAPHEHQVAELGGRENVCRLMRLRGTCHTACSAVATSLQHAIHALDRVQRIVVVLQQQPRDCARRQSAVTAMQHVL